MALMDSPTKQITDARLFRQTEMAEAESYLLDGGEVSVFSARAPQKETANEDAAALILFSQSAAVLVVADGMGGGRSGEQASAAAVAEVRAAVRRAAAAGDLLRTGILNGFEAANRAVRAMGVGAATTLAVVEVDQQIARPYHVGDSMILITGQRGRIKLQTAIPVMADAITTAVPTVNARFLRTACAPNSGSETLAPLSETHFNSTHRSRPDCHRSSGSLARHRPTT